MDNIYPVGSIHITTNSVNPSTYFGGTWEKISGGYLYAAASTIQKTTYTGWGTQSHTLTVNQIPAHAHAIKAGYGDIGSPTVNYDSYRYQYWGGNNNGWKSGNLGTGNTGGGQGHTHNIATVDVFVWKRTA